jgi:hypothetical protein
MDRKESKLRFRPRFRLIVDKPPNELIESIRKAIDKNQAICTGEIVDHHIILKVPKSQQHYWSPQLALELEANDSGTMVRGLFGPKPNVWTMFVFFYSSIGFLTTMGLIFGLSQMMLKMSAYGLWSVPIGGLLLIGLFVMSKVGQNLGKSQMDQLSNILQSVLDQ